MSNLHATAFSTTLPLPQLAAQPSWSILSSHHHACNLLAGDGTIIALVDEMHGNGPFHIVVPHARFDRSALDAFVRWQEGQITLADRTIDLRMARPWNPRPPFLLRLPTQVQLKPYRVQVTLRSSLYSGPTAITTRAQQGIVYMRQGVLKSDTQLLHQGVEALAGLGPGLTPAGDDFLLGFMVALSVNRNNPPGLHQQRALIAQSAAKATTPLSATWLHHAGQGHVGMRWHELVHALNNETEVQIGQTIKSIINTGATSGADALCGFLVGIEIQHTLTQITY